MTQPFRIANDGALGIEGKDITDMSEDGMTIAVLRFHKDHGLNFMWLPLLFNNSDLPMPEELRAAIVHVLRFHADKLESGDVDRRMKEISKAMDQGGTT